MRKGLNFTPEEEKEFQEMTKLHPKGFKQKVAVIFDSKANTVEMFFILLIFSMVSYFFLKSVLDQMLFLSNTYQLIALPILGVATGLSTMIILRFLFRIFLEIRKEFGEIKKMHKELHEIVKEMHNGTHQRTKD